MLAADTDFQVRSSRASALLPHLDQLPDAVAVDRHKRIVRQNAVLV